MRKNYIKKNGVLILYDGNLRKSKFFHNFIGVKHPIHVYHRCLASVREHDKPLALQLLQHLKAGRNKRAIQQIDRQLKQRNHLVVGSGLRGLKQLITTKTSEN